MIRRSSLDGRKWAEIVACVATAYSGLLCLVRVDGREVWIGAAFVIAP